MPAKSQAQANLFRAAEHGADFAMARKLRGSMTLAAMHDFSVTPSKGLPKHVKQNKSSVGHPAANLGKYHHLPKR